jgi:8-oxo-dGTP pyrophosphatase MutT (NUDIX family)
MVTDRRESAGGRGAPLREAAVLIPLVEAEASPPALVFIHRSKQGRHGDQIGFPGGRIEPGDATPVAAALREFEEEVGVDRGLIEVLESLAAMETRTTGYRVFPVLGRLRHLPAWSPDPREVADVLVIPLVELTRPENRGETVMTFGTWAAPRAVPYIDTGGRRIWGLTYRILEAVLPRLASRSATPRP